MVVMNSAVLPSWQANLDLRFAQQGQRTSLASNTHSGPLRVQKALYPEAKNPHICHTIIVHPPAGVAGADALAVNIELLSNTHAVITTPGATQWYKSNKVTPAKMVAKLCLAEDAKLDWLPQENIFFDSSNAQVQTDIDLHPTATVLGWDVCVLGRSAAGENWQQAALQQQTTLTRGDKPLWIEHSLLHSADALRTSGVALASHRIMGTLWAVGTHLNSEHSQAYAAVLPYTAALKAGITFLQDNHYSGGAVVLRVLGNDMESVRHLMVQAWCHFRPIVHGVPAVSLRLWAM